LLTEQQREAARWLGAGKLNDAEVARAAGISVRTLVRWKKLPEVRKAAEAAGRAWREKAKKFGIGDPDRRLYQLNDRWRRLQHIIEQRSRAEIFKDAPGGKSGLLTVTFKQQTHTDYSGEKPVRISELVPEYAVDTGMLAEMRALERAAAVELGQHKDAPAGDTNITVVAPQAVVLAKLLTTEQLEELRDKLKGAETK
jgi:hypothetical protein